MDYGLNLSGALKEFSITTQFLGFKNAKSIFLEEKRVFRALFQTEANVISYRPSRPNP